jgi:tight adherence protein B
VNSGAIRATEDVLSRRPAQRASGSGGRGFALQQPPTKRRPLLKRLILTFCLLVVGFFTAATVAGAAGGGLSLVLSNLDMSAYPHVSVAMQMGGEQAAALGDVTKDEISIKVDGTAVPVDSLKTAGQGVAPAVHTVLLIDASGSMKGAAITAASAAATTFVDAMKTNDTAAVEAFNVTFRVLQDFSGDTGALKASLGSLAPQKETALYDAVIKALASFPQGGPSAARYVILLSDGGDTASTATLDQTVSSVRAAGIPVYAVGLKSQEFDSAPLQSIADASGGRYLETTDPAALTSIYRTLAKELHNQYLLTFTVPQSSPAAGVGKLSVQVTGAGTATVAEQGFFYPAAQTTTTIAGATTTTATSTPAVSEQNTTVSRFLGWGGSPYIIGVVVFLLVMAVLYMLWGVMFPRRDVLAEYEGLIDRKNLLGPQALDEEPRRHPSAVQRAATRLLSVRGYQHPLQRLIDDAALKFRASEFALLQLIALVVILVVAAVLRLPLFGLIILALVLIIVPLLWLDSKGDARRKAFNDQVPNTLMLLAGALKAGQALEQALNVASMESPQPTQAEFQRVTAQLRLGVVPEDALGHLAERMRSEAFGWAVMSTVIQRQVGGNLAEIYESTAHTLRERAKLRREIDTLTAEGRISAIILVILPFVVGIMVGIINSGYLKPLLSTTMGNVMLGMAFVLMVVGIIWMRAIVRVDK